MTRACTGAETPYRSIDLAFDVRLRAEGKGAEVVAVDEVRRGLARRELRDLGAIDRFARRGDRPADVVLHLELLAGVDATTERCDAQRQLGEEITLVRDIDRLERSGGPIDRSIRPELSVDFGAAPFDDR